MKVLVIGGVAAGVHDLGRQAGIDDEVLSKALGEREIVFFAQGADNGEVGQLRHSGFPFCFLLKQQNLSVTPSACHLPYRGEALAFRKAYSLRQRLPSVGELSSASETERLSTHYTIILSQELSVGKKQMGEKWADFWFFLVKSAKIQLKFSSF